MKRQSPTGWKRSLFLAATVVALLPSCAGDGFGPGGAASRAVDPATSSAIVRLNAQLMVAGLHCGRQWRDPGAFERYRAFSSRNSVTIMHAQQVASRVLGGDERFGLEHTELYNRELLRLRRMGAAAYCAEMRPLFDAATESRELADASRG